MRIVASALIALACLGWNAAPADARSRDQAQAQGRQAPRAAAPPQASRAPAASQTSRASAARASAAPQRAAAAPRQSGPRQVSASQARGARQATTRTGTRTSQQAAADCRGGNCAPRSRSVSWQGGLEPATNAQAHACPSGTLATLAHGHSNIVRCMPL